MQKICYIPLLWLTLLFFSSPLWSQSTEEPEMPQLYDVEVVLFAHTAASAINSENWPVDVTIPENANAVFIQDAAADTPEAAEASPAQYTLLPTDTLRLVAEARSIARRRSAFEPLIHISWRQPGLERDQTPSVYVQSRPQDSRSGQQLQGLITVSRRRYLHIDLDLLLEKPSLALQTSSSLLEEQPPTAFRIQNHRKMRSGELHYLDHPLMGALVLVSKYEPPEETEIPLSEEAAPEAGVETATAEATDTPANAESTTTPATSPAPAE